jgi:hypothetical protein
MKARRIFRSQQPWAQGYEAQIDAAYQQTLLQAKGVNIQARPSAAIRTLQLRASTTIGVSVTNTDGTSAFLYRRPNGKLGQIKLNPLNLLA